ncbi:translationally-controlled tumor protein homolog [[Candida] jaroonii]|uniref:Translationally-controlled tumor protein homolog n=1 Tax=[Candida] jaroonii TaxID=467808 RepID=A0ACA9Y972_9ASCO|nr:translationally-controlled tumor protein homolog [[Candida] jaroonii]
MLIYKDVITGDNLFSDQYPFKEVGDAVYEVSFTSVDGKNLVEEFNLQPTFFDKKSFLENFRSYGLVVSKYLEESNPDSVRPFQANSMAYVKEHLQNIKDFEFYTGPSGILEGMVVMVPDEEVALFWKYGVQPSES